MKRQRAEMGQILHEPTKYGESVEGLPIKIFLPESGAFETLVMAAIHGDEGEGTCVLSDALRSVAVGHLKAGVILVANPDGVLRGTRANANGVDLNRNMPAKNWSPEPVFYKTLDGEPQDVRLSTGTQPGSEPENRALIEVLEQYQPKSVLSLHAALACIDDPNASVLGKILAERTELELVDDVGYPTPGSFGSWAAERNLNLITYELEAASAYELKRRHVPVLYDVLIGKLGPEGYI